MGGAGPSAASLDDPKSRTKNAKAHVVHLSEQSMAVLKHADQGVSYVFSRCGNKPFSEFSQAKLRLDQLSGVKEWRLHDLRRTCVSGMARLGIAPHVADKILNHQSGTISGVAAVYQRHEFLRERRQALDLWGAYVGEIVSYATKRYSFLSVHFGGPLHAEVDCTSGLENIQASEIFGELVREQMTRPKQTE